MNREQKRWVVRPAGDRAKIAQISSATHISPILAELLLQRGINTVEAADDFFNPKIENLHDPFLMQDMMKAVLRIEQAIRSKQRVMIYGDYDVDGISAVSLVYIFLGQWMDDIMFYIPDRYA
ncbi:MAG: single-stranded-DNA-specific exonuclease RecJ, partial [Mucinivorans sp.]